MDDSRAYRDALSAFPTGVALVTILHEGRPTVMTVNSFSSVSLEPRLILWSLAHDSERYRAFRIAQLFAVNILGADQERLSVECARKEDLDAVGAAWTQGEQGVPLVEGAVARFQCRRVAVHPAGDHDIIVGEVLGFDALRDSPSLVFHRSRYSSAQ